MLDAQQLGDGSGDGHFEGGTKQEMADNTDSNSGYWS